MVRIGRPDFAVARGWYRVKNLCRVPSALLPVALLVYERGDEAQGYQGHQCKIIDG